MNIEFSVAGSKIDFFLGCGAKKNVKRMKPANLLIFLSSESSDACN